MAGLIYKPGQGYWTRMMSAIGAGVIALYGASWTANQFQGVSIRGLQPTIIQGITLGTISLLGAIIIYFVFGRHKRVNEFFIATEGEMRKVNWSTKREIIGSTWVVICGTAFIACLLFTINICFTWLFRYINLLEG